MTHPSKTLWVALIALLAFGCADAQPQAPMANPPTNPSSTLTQQPLTIQQAVEEAVEKNLELLAKRYDIKIAEARIITAGMTPNPTLSVGADHLDLLGTGYSAENAAGPSEYSLRADWTFEGGGKRQRRLEVAELTKEVIKLEILESSRQTVYEVEKAFIDVLLAQANLSLAQENRGAFSRIVRVSTERVRFGDLAKVELTRTKLAELQYDNSVTLARVRLRTAKQNLAYLLGRDGIDDDLEVEGNLSRAVAPAEPEKLEAIAIIKRPDYLGLLKDQERSKAAIALEEANGRINYTVGLEYRRQEGLAGRGNSVGVFLSVPLPTNDTNEGEILRAQHEYDQLQAKQKAMLSKIRLQIATATQQFKAAEKTLNQIEKSMLTQARQVLDTLEYSYRTGHSTLVELLDAQRAYNDVVLSYNEALAEFSRSRYLLENCTAQKIQETQP